jgi:hypothetical protein
LLGQSIDQQLLGPGPRRGPRLGDLAVQSSSYGSAIPKIFGTMRVAGTVVWSTELQEQTQTEAAKGQPETVTYNYSASFAVALSSRRISGIGRIWADGKLIRNADGVFSVATDFRLYDGSEDQQPDQLIASIEGIDSTPAFRGLALAVFENLQLADFGNRIPFLTFEVIADAAPVTVASVLADVSGAVIESADVQSIGGYAAYGNTAQAAVEQLVNAFGVPLLDDGSKLISPAAGSSFVSGEDSGCSGDDRRAPRIERSQTPSAALPWAVTISYYDPAREYQAGLARSSLNDRTGSVEQVELPAVLDAISAKGLAETLLARRWAQRDKLTLRLPPDRIDLRPGSLVHVGEGADAWRAERVTIDSLTVVVELRPNYGAVDALPADPGRAVTSPAIEILPTRLAIVELPDDGSGRADSPIVAIAASGNNGRSIPLTIETNGVALSANSARAAAIGSALTALGSGQSAVFDLLNSVDVKLSDADAWLESRDDDSLAAGANTALLGTEMFQFGNAVPLGSGTFRLSRLLRGRLGTDWAMADHNVGDPFVLLNPARLLTLPLTRAQVGARVRVTPLGLGDDGTAFVEHLVTGEAMRQPSPVHLRASFDTFGNLNCTWVRRSCLGWDWLDGVDAPLGSAVELYRATLMSSSAKVQVETPSPAAQFTATQIGQLGSGNLQLVVEQVGDFAVSRPASLSIIN